MKKKVIPAFLLLLFAPSCIFVVSETHEAESSNQPSEQQNSQENNEG